MLRTMNLSMTTINSSLYIRITASYEMNAHPMGSSLNNGSSLLIIKLPNANLLLKDQEADINLADMNPIVSYTMNNEVMRIATGGS